MASAVARNANDTANQLVGFPANTGTSGVTPFASSIPVSTITGLTADLGPQLSGTPVTVTASAAGGTAPYQFKWWLWNGATWTMQVDWSTGNIFTWIPGTPNPNYAIGVWVRSAGNTADQPDGYPTNAAAYKAIAFVIN